MKEYILFFGFLFLFTACNDTISRDKNTGGDYYQESEMIEEVTASPVSEKAYSNTNEQEVTQQKIIKTAFLSFETPSIDQTYRSIKKSVISQNGFIQKDNTSKSYDRITRRLLLRIPNTHFQTLVDTIISSAKVLDKRDITSKNVTEEFVDLKARLKAKQRLKERYLQLLAKAKNVSDMLEIERNISIIQEEIEAKQGRLKYLQSQVSFSTIQVDFYEMIPTEKAPSQTYINRLWRAVKGGFTGIGNFLIGLVYVWPFILIAVLIGLLIRNKIRKRKKIK